MTTGVCFKFFASFKPATEQIRALASQSNLFSCWKFYVLKNVPELFVRDGGTSNTFAVFANFIIGEIDSSFQYLMDSPAYMLTLRGH